MIVKKILDYIGANSNNINPSVLETVLQNGVMEAVEVANEYTDSQRIAYTETKTLTWDGDITGKTVIVSSETDHIREELVLVSEEPLLLISEGISIPGFSTNNKYKTVRQEFHTGQEKKLTHENIMAGMIAPGMCVVTDIEAEEDYMISLSEDLGDGSPKGTYFPRCVQSPGTDHEVIWYTSYVEYETIKTIDPKYIPTLDSLTLNGADGKQYKLIIDNLGLLKTEEV